MGHLKRRRHLRSQDQASSLSFNLVIFVVLLCLLVLTRVSYLVPLVTDLICDSDNGFFRASSSQSASTLELLALAAGLAVTLQLTLAILSWRRWTYSGAIFGSINLAIGSALLVLSLIGWSFYHPTHPAARHVNAWSQLLP